MFMGASTPATDILRLKALRMLNPTGAVQEPVRRVKATLPLVRGNGATMKAVPLTEGRGV